jgi:hypothetical protein
MDFVQTFTRDVILTFVFVRSRIFKFAFLFFVVSLVGKVTMRSFVTALNGVPFDLAGANGGPEVTKYLKP